MQSTYPDIALLRRQAKRLLRQAQEGDPGAVRLFTRRDRGPKLADAQYAVATAVGFSSWPALVRAVESARHDPVRTELRTRVILVRGGFGDSHGRFNQHGGPGLDDSGRAQARAAAALLAATAPAGSAVVLTSRRRRSIETAEAISSALGLPPAQETCDLCEMHPGDAEGLTPEEMAERFGPNYAFVPGAESWTDFVPRASTALNGLAEAHRGKTVIGVTESAVVKASFVAFGGMPPAASEVIRTSYGSVTEWSCLVQGDIRRVGTWRLERYNITA